MLLTPGGQSSTRSRIEQDQWTARVCAAHAAKTSDEKTLTATRRHSEDREGLGSTSCSLLAVSPCRCESHPNICFWTFAPLHPHRYALHSSRPCRIDSRNGIKERSRNTLAATRRRSAEKKGICLSELHAQIFRLFAAPLRRCVAAREILVGLCELGESIPVLRYRPAQLS